MNPDAIIRAVLILAGLGTVNIIAGLVIDFFFMVIRDDFRNHRLTSVLCMIGIILIAAALITNFIFIITR